jgi:hypothetical protein
MHNQEEPNILFKSSSWHRLDLSTDIRIKIASIALFFNIHGTITKLSQRYGISRQFVYDLKDELANLYEIHEKKIELSQNEKLLRGYEMALSLRMEGKCSINSIHTIMERLDMPYASVGSISEHLKFAGASLPSVSGKSDTLTFSVFASDEIYSKARPILITCDPASFVILHIKLCDSCTSDEWEGQWNALRANGVVPLYITKDEGTEMECASKKIF